MLEVTKTMWSKIQAMAIARAFSLLGSELTLFTLVFREKEQGPAAVAALFIAGTLPMIIFAPWAGTIADRFSTKQVIPIFSVIGGAAVFCQTQHLATWLILTLLFISNTSASVVAPTWGKLTPTLATKEDISRAMGTIQTYFSMAMLLGPFVAGFLVSQTGFIATFVIDGIFTTLIACMPLILNVNHEPEAKEEGEKVKVTEGFIFILKNKFLRALVIMVFGVVLCMSVINVGDVFLLTEIMKADALIYGLVGGFFAVGTLVSSLIIGARKAAPRVELLLLGIGTAVLSLSGLAVGLAPNYWFVMVVWFIAGSANATINTYGVGMMIKAIPHEVQGRAFAAFNAIISIASIGSMSVAGLLIGVFGVREVFITAGILAAISYVVLYPTVHREQSKVISQEA
jgi:MFS family permease